MDVDRIANAAMLVVVAILLCGAVYALVRAFTW